MIAGRKITKMFRRLTAVLLCLLLVSNVKVQAEGSEDKVMGLNALHACLLDADSGRVLYEKDGYSRVAMASTTKIMTCLVILEQADLEDTVTVSKYASTMPDVQLNAREGEQYKVKDLLYALMLESYNDVAVALAEHVGGSVEGFAEMMNRRAASMGLKDTNFVTPNGLDAEGHYTTAVDLCRIAAEAVRNEAFLEVVGTQSWTFSELISGRTFTASNKDRFLSIYEGAFGIKTGFTNQAGYCFVGAAESDGRTLISAVLASGWPPNKNYKWVDTTALMNYGFHNYQKKIIAEGEIQLKPIPVRHGKTGEVSLSYNAVLDVLAKEEERIWVTYKLPETLEAPVQEHAKVGYAAYYIDGACLAEIPVYTAGTVEKTDFQFYLERLLRQILG